MYGIFFQIYPEAVTATNLVFNLTLACALSPIFVFISITSKLHQDNEISLNAERQQLSPSVVAILSLHTAS